MQESFLGEAMYVSISKRKSEIASLVSELNPKLGKTGVLPQTLKLITRMLDHKILAAKFRLWSHICVTQK